MPGDAKMRLVDTQEIEPVPSQQACQRAFEAAQERAEEPIRAGVALGGMDAPAASERVPWWRMFGS